MDSPLNDFPSEPTSRIQQFAPIVDPSPRKRRSRKRKWTNLAVLAAPFRFVRAASIRASRKIARAANQAVELLRPLSTSVRSRRSSLAVKESHHEDIPHIAHDAGLTQDVAVSSLQRAVATSLTRETPRRTGLDLHESSPRMMALAVTAALIAGVTYGIMWQRPWIVSPKVAVPQAGVSAEAASPPDAIPAVSEPPGIPAIPASPAISDAGIETGAPVRVRSAAIAPVRSGQLQVVTEPPGARVTVDGVGRGVTPVTIRHLPPGTKRVRVTKEGYAGAERVVAFGQSDAGYTVRIPLKRRQ